MKNNNSKITAPQEITNLMAEELHASFEKKKGEVETLRTNGELKLCPFCGHMQVENVKGYTSLFMVFCERCGAIVYFQSKPHKAQVVVAWNTRPPLTPDQVSQWLQDNGYEDMSKSVDCDFEL